MKSEVCLALRLSNMEGHQTYLKKTTEIYKQLLEEVTENILSRNNIEHSLEMNGGRTSSRNY